VESSDDLEQRRLRRGGMDGPCLTNSADKKACETLLNEDIDASQACRLLCAVSLVVAVRETLWISLLIGATPLSLPLACLPRSPQLCRCSTSGAASERWRVGCGASKASRETLWNASCRAEYPSRRFLPIGSAPKDHRSESQALSKRRRRAVLAVRRRAGGRLSSTGHTKGMSHIRAAQPAALLR
jgi:hypothetical protein